MLKKVEKVVSRYQELEGLLGDPQVLSDQAQYQKFAKEFADISSIVQKYYEYQKILRHLQDVELMLQEKHDHDFLVLLREECEDLKQNKQSLEQELELLLNPPKEEKDRPVIMEIRAGTGGQEASLFAADLYRMYCRYADRRGWKVEMMGSHVSETGGFKEIILSIKGKGASKCLKWESGAHRVQRVPVTEASGRIHTSAATVAVLFEPEEIDEAIDPKDLRIDIFRSSGPGGQSVNTADSAIRITHLPTGIVVCCQDERSQLKNKNKAMRVLRARLLDKRQQDQMAKESQFRKAQVGSGDRSEKIRTYNYPEHRVTDHRIGVTVHKLPAIMDGDLDDIINGLLKAEEALEAQGK